MPNWPTAELPTQRHEVCFGERLLRCFYPRPHSLDQLLREALERNPDGDALVCAEHRSSYRELNAAVDALAAGLLSLGITPGARVAILLANRPEFVHAVLAAARIGAISVPINIREQTPELEYILNHCGAALVFVEAAIAERLPAASALPALKTRIAIGGEVAEAVPIESLLQARNAPQPVVGDEQETAVILYTSGTTGRPKGAMLTHLNLCHSVMHYQYCLRLGNAERSVLAVPASHVTGLVAILLTMLRVAGCSVIMPVFKARAFLELAERESITHTVMVPAMYNLCLREHDFADFDLAPWRIGAYGGAPMPQASIAALAAKLPDLQLVNAYGATETTSPTTIMPPGQTAAHADSVGQVVPCAEVRIMDPAGCELPPGEAGEIWIAGPMLVPGYWHNPEAGKAAFTAGYWRSGDIGSKDEAGYVRIFDRIKDMVNRGGYKIYSAELENTLNYHPAVIECAVVPYPDEVLGEKIHAFVHATQAVSRDELRAFCAERLSDYKVPDYISLVDAPLPRNANGKLIKRSLRRTAPQQAFEPRS